LVTASIAELPASPGVYGGITHRAMGTQIGG
jgi:hypothetical protein